MPIPRSHGIALGTINTRAAPESETHASALEEAPHAAWNGATEARLCARPYHSIANRANVRTATPDGPFAKNGLASSSQAVPAISR